MQLKRVLTLILTVVFVFSLAAPASAVDAVYSVSPDTSVLSAPIYYTEGYYPGAVVEMRNAGMFANRIAYGSFASGNYTPTYFYNNGSSINIGELPLYYPDVIADQSDVSAVSTVPATSLISGSLLSVKLPASNDAYFDFQSSNFLFDQQSPDANTFYVNGDLTFNLRNLWSFSGSPSNDSFYLASDPLAVQLLIDGQPYGDIIDVTGYTSPFTSLYGGAVPANATVHFDNMKVYYQGDTPDMIGFRVLTGSAFTDGRYNYNGGGNFSAVTITNTITFRCSEMPDITFVQEGGDGYAGDLSGIQSILNSILSGISGLRTLMVDSSGNSFLSRIPSIEAFFYNLYGVFVSNDYRFWSYNSDGTSQLYYVDGLVGLFENYFSQMNSGIQWVRYFVKDQVYSWRPYNLDTHELDSATNVTGLNLLMFTAFQSMEDKLGRLAYVFGSDEDLALKDSADPGTDAFRENFGGGLSLGQIKDGADVVEGVSGLFDSGYDFGDAFTEISGDSMFTMWFSSQNAAALDSTSSVMALDDDDPYNMQIYYDRIYEVTAKRDREEGDTNG